MQTGTRRIKYSVWHGQNPTSLPKRPESCRCQMRRGDHIAEARPRIETRRADPAARSRRLKFVECMSS